jgi:hypothetical protein
VETIGDAGEHVGQSNAAPSDGSKTLTTPRQVSLSLLFLLPSISLLIHSVPFETLSGIIFSLNNDLCDSSKVVCSDHEVISLSSVRELEIESIISCRAERIK